MIAPAWSPSGARLAAGDELQPRVELFDLEGRALGGLDVRDEDGPVRQQIQELAWPRETELSVRVADSDGLHLLDDRWIPLAPPETSRRPRRSK